MKRACVVALVCLMAAVVPWVILAMVNTTSDPPTREVLAERCSRHCHNRGCPHDPVLPASLTGNEGLFGQTVRALHQLGQSRGSGRGWGYAAANLAVFVVLWPALMLALLAAVTWQRLAIRSLRRRAPPGGGGDAKTVG